MEAALRLCAAMNRFWVYRGYYSEGRSWCGRALALSNTSEQTVARAGALGTNGTLAWIQGDLPEAYRFHEEALAIRRELGDVKGIAPGAGAVGDGICPQAKSQGSARAA